MTVVDAASARGDKNQVGVTPAGQAVLDQLKGDYFDSEAAAFQAAVCLAIRLDLQPTGESGLGTKWGLGTHKELLDFVSWYLPTETPARTVEILGDSGLAYLGKRIAPGRTLMDLFFAK